MIRTDRLDGSSASSWTKPAKPIPIHPFLGKELCILCWAVEEAPPDDIPNALRNWEPWPTIRSQRRRHVLQGRRELLAHSQLLLPL